MKVAVYAVIIAVAMLGMVIGTLIPKPSQIEKPIICEIKLEAMRNICCIKKGEVCRVAQWKYLECIKDEK